MTPDEIQRLARRLAEMLARQGWLPHPVRPEPPTGPRPEHLPPWAAAAQSLDDVAPGGDRSRRPRHRPAYDVLTAAARAAASGRGTAPDRGHPARAPSPDRGRSVPVAVSNRHVHLSATDVATLFGGELTSDRAIRQPGQFAAQERVRVVGPRGAIDGVRVVGPPRDRSQVELARSDARSIGVDLPVAASGDLEGSCGVRLEGPAGHVDLPRGAIVPARHLHLAPEDARRLDLHDGDRITLAVGTGDRRATLPDVLVRAGATHATELHLDVDEAHACGVEADTRARLVGRPRRGAVHPARAGARRVVTERDVAAIAAAGQTLARGPGVVVTPSAVDRAKALGIWRD